MSSSRLPLPTARAVLFALPDRVLRGLYQTHAGEIATFGLGADPREFRAHIKALRERGWTYARAVVVVGRVGIGAPVMCDGIVRGSLGVSLTAPLDDGEIERVGRIVMREAELVGAELRKDTPEVPRLLGRRPKARSDRISPTLQ